MRLQINTAYPRMSFSDALFMLLNKGLKISRVGWDLDIPIERFLIYVPGSNGDIDIRPGSPYGIAGFQRTTILGHIDCYTGLNSVQPGWTPTQEDMLANDWVIMQESMK